MSGETEESVSGWTTDTLHSHMAIQFVLLREQIDRQREEIRMRTQIALDAHEEALRVAASNTEKAISAALDAQREATKVQADTLRGQQAVQNEWRASLNDVSVRAMSRSEAEAAILRAMEAIHEIRLLLQTMVARPEFDAARAHDAERLNDLATRVTQAEAMARGGKENRAGLYAAIGAVGVLITIVVFIANAVLR